MISLKRFKMRGAKCGVEDGENRCGGVKAFSQQAKGPCRGNHSRGAIKDSRDHCAVHTQGVRGNDAHGDPGTNWHS